MGVTKAHRSARRFRRARRLRHQRQGLVAVIGTLLALLVFFALFGIFLTQYLPLWMTDNESAFSSAAATSFAQFKADVDSQYVLGVPPVLGAPFTVSSQGIPLLAQPTQGTLTFLPQTCPAGFNAVGKPVNTAYCIFENQTVGVGPGGSGPLYLEVPTGILAMSLPNRYFPGEYFQYEADGVVQAQSGGAQIMAFAPPLNITRNAGNTTVTASFLQLYGNATTVVSQGSEEVYSHLRFAQYLTSNGNRTTHSFSYSYTVGTQFPCAWSNFFWSQLNSSGIPSAQYSFTPYSGSCINPGGVTTDLTVTLSAVNYVTIFYAGTAVTVGIGSS